MAQMDYTSHYRISIDSKEHRLIMLGLTNRLTKPIDIEAAKKLADLFHEQRLAQAQSILKTINNVKPSERKADDDAEV